MVCQFCGKSSDRSCKSILAWVARCDSFLSSAFSVSISLMANPRAPRLGARDLREFFDAGQRLVDCFLSLHGQRFEVIEAEAMHVAQRLSQRHQLTHGDEQAPETFVMQFQGRR